MRSVAKSSVGVIPGVSSYVDSSFDALEELHETHGPEFEKVLQAAYDDVRSILKDASNQDSLDPSTAAKLVGVLRKRVGELNALGQKAGGDAFGKFEKQYPGVAQTLGGAYSDLRALAARGGPEAKKLMDESTKEMQDILSQKDVPDAMNRAKDVLSDKTSQIKEMLWDKAVEETNANPQLRELLNESKEKFVRDEASLGTLREVLERIRETAKDKEGMGKEKIDEMKKYLEEKGNEGQSGWKGWTGLQEWVKSVPGGEEVSNLYLQSLDSSSLTRAHLAIDRPSRRSPAPTSKRSWTSHRRRARTPSSWRTRRIVM